MLVSIDRIAMAVDGNDAGEIDDFKPIDSFAQQIGESDQLAFADGVSVERAGAADGSEVNGVRLADGVAYGFVAFAFSDHAFETAPQKPRRKGIHARAGRGAAAPACFSGRSGTRPGVINGFSGEGKRQGLVAV